MNLNTKNFKKGPMTSITGLVLIASGIASVFIPEVSASWPEALIAIAAGASLLFLEDKNNGGPTTNVDVKGDATINTPKDKEDPGSIGGKNLKSLGWLFVFLIAVFMCGSCNTIRVPGNEDRASRVVAKNFRQNAAIFEAFPDIKEDQNIAITLPDVYFDTVYVPVPNEANDARIAELEALLEASGDTVIIEKWRDYVTSRPPTYEDGTYTFETDLFKSDVILDMGEIRNNVNVKERNIQAPQPIIREVQKTSLFDWLLRIGVVIAITVVVVLLFVRRRA